MAGVDGGLGAGPSGSACGRFEVPPLAAPEDAGTARSGCVSPSASGADQAAARGQTAAQQRAAQKELARLERQIARLTDAEAQLSADLAEHASDYTRLIELGAQLREIQADRAGLEERWLEVAEQLG